MDSEIYVEITAKHAVLIPLLANVKSLLAYVEAVAVVIGSRHIHSIFEDRNCVKVYLTNERYVDVLVNSGITILGRRVNVDYVVPRADKVILSNVDPIIPDSSLLNLLSFYGTPVSTVIHDKIATTSEYSHIECGSRKVYMKIFEGKKLPSKIKFTYQAICYHIDVMVESLEKPPIIETEPILVEEDRIDEDETLDVNSQQSAKPNIGDLSIRDPTPKQLAYWNRRRSERKSAALAARQIQKRAKKRWLKSEVKVRRIEEAGQVVRQVQMPGRSGKVKQIVRKKFKASVAKRLRKGVRRNLIKKPPIMANSSIDASLLETEMEDAVSLSGKSTDQNMSETSQTEDATQFPLTTDEFEKFMFKCRFHREPLQVAVEFHVDKKMPEKLYFTSLQSQLTSYRKGCKDVAVKMRIKRLIALIDSKLKGE